jgi:pimeloyl-ACP methyl ester carboxylesterase
MPRQVVIVHGWSDNSASFEPLAGFLKSQGYDPVPVWLGDYISLDDDVNIPDVAKRMQAVFEDLWTGGKLERNFDLIVHSTGGLVAREWLTAYYLHDPATIPVRRLVMLAPANYGSRLASMGQSMLGRVVKGWNNWFHTGTQMLDALELASPYQWALAQRDIFAEHDTDGRSIYGADCVLPFVITGSHPYDSMLRQIVNEDGSDGTVRVPAANLNARGATLDFCGAGEQPVFTPWKRRCDAEFPLAVLPCRTHASIIDPAGGDIAAETPAQKAQLGALILEALACRDWNEYGAIQKKWFQISEDTAGLASDGRYHQYCQLNVFVVDDHGAPVKDYFLEFTAPDYQTSDTATVYFHKSVIEDVHTNAINPASRCLYLDRTDLQNGYYPQIPAGLEKIVTISLSANAPGKNVQYFSDRILGAKGEFKLHSLDAVAERWLKRNTTHFIRIVIPRLPLEQVFRLRRFGA